MNRIRIVAYQRAADFLTRAEEWLLREEAENNVILSVAGRIALEDSDSDEHLFLTVEIDGNIEGCVFRTPPWKLVMTECPTVSIDDLVDAVHERYPDLTGILGPRDTARSFAATWSRRFGSTFRPGMHQRVYELTTVVLPNPPVRGEPRPAGERDRTLLVKWLTEFYNEVGFPLDDAEDAADRFLKEGEAWMWCNPEPTSLAVCTGHTRNGVRIGLVFTPSDSRGNGYASGITAALSQNALDRGKTSCFLFADAENLTSNKIYQRIGFKPVADVVDYLIEPRR